MVLRVRALHSAWIRYLRMTWSEVHYLCSIGVQPVLSSCDNCQWALSEVRFLTILSWTNTSWAILDQLSYGGKSYRRFAAPWWSELRVRQEQFNCGDSIIVVLLTKLLLQARWWTRGVLVHHLEAAQLLRHPGSAIRLWAQVLRLQVAKCTRSRSQRWIRMGKRMIFLQCRKFLTTNKRRSFGSLPTFYVVLLLLVILNHIFRFSKLHIPCHRCNSRSFRQAVAFSIAENDCGTYCIPQLLERLLQKNRVGAVWEEIWSRSQILTNALYEAMIDGGGDLSRQIES